MEKWRILVVDDEADMRNLIRSCLEPTYEIVEARDGLDALEKLERAEPDLIVLDIMMPLMDGIETCRAIRRNYKYRDMTVLFLSALNSREHIERGYTAGANLYLTKPFDPRRLRRNVDLFFEKKAADAPPRRHLTLQQLQDLDRQGPKAVSRETVRRDPLRPRPSALPNHGKARILVVDDEPGICTLATGALHHEFEVFCAADGIDAIQKITAYQPDIIIIDTMMPRMSGYQLCQSLRQNARYAHTPIIIASAKHSHKDREYSMRIGGTAFLQKPYTGIEILHAVHEILKHPDFHVYPKALTAEAIAEIEEVHHHDERVRDQERIRVYDVKEIENFIQQHSHEPPHHR